MKKKNSILSLNTASSDACKSVTKNNYHRRELFWKTVVVITLFICYGLNYFTRNHIYVTTDLFKHYLDPNNPENAQKWLGIMYTFGSIGFLMSKLLFSIFIDTKINSGVKPFVFGLISVALVSCIMALIDIDNQTFRIITVIFLFFLLRGCLAPQWAGVIKIISSWMNYSEYGRIISLMSLSFLAGDAFTRAIYGYILTIDGFNDWRTIFYFGSGITFIIVIPVLILVKDSPTQRGLNPAQQNPENAYAYLSNTTKPDNYQSFSTESVEIDKSNIKFSELLKPLLIQPMFYFILLFNMELSYLRGYFNMYSASYLQSIGASKSNSVFISALFPLIGVISAPLNGIWIDKMLKTNRPICRYILFPIQGIIICFATIIFFLYQDIDIEVAIVLMLISGFGLLGCYSMIYVLSLDLGGNKSPTIVSGISDCVGLLGQMIMTFLSGFGDYHFMFGTLSIISICFFVTSALLVLYKSCKSSIVTK